MTTNVLTHSRLSTYRTCPRRHWKRCKAEAAARTDGLCQFCGLREGTEGHHLKYVRPELQEARWVVWLCSDCHKTATALRKNGFGRASRLMTDYTSERNRIPAL